MQTEFDYVIVGAGTAGCVLAARLSEDLDASVCLLEAGGDARHFAAAVPAGVVQAQRIPELNWAFQTVPQPALNGRRIGVPRGRGLGGSALINGMVYFRGHTLDFDDWAAAGAAGWSSREVLPYFRRTEHNEDFGDSPFHGRGGEMNVRTVTHPNPLNLAFLEAADSLGIPRREDLIGTDTEGAALRQLNIRGGRRETSARALLGPARGRTNLTVMTGLTATRVRIQDRRATGVLALAREGPRVIGARREVVLCAGAIQSPQLLLLSGVGDGEELRDLDLDVVHHLPGVGRNLHDHLACPVHVTTPGDATSYGMSLRALPRNLAYLLRYLVSRTGPIANNIFESAAFVRTLPGLDRPDVQLVFQPARRPSPHWPFPIGHGYAISPVGLYPASRGRVTLASPDPLVSPLIDPALLSEPQDLDPLLRGIRLARRLLAAPAFERFGGVETAPGRAVTDDDELTDYVRAEAYTVHHPVGSCRMGVDADAVVDPALRVHGLEGLRVADASVFPSIIGGNTNAVVVMVAERAADLIRGRPPLPLA